MTGTHIRRPKIYAQDDSFMTKNDGTEVKKPKFLQPAGRAPVQSVYDSESCFDDGCAASSRVDEHPHQKASLYLSEAVTIVSAASREL